MNTVKRSEVTPDYKYTVQVQSQAGNWVDNLRTNDRATAEGMVEYIEARHKENARLVLETE